MHKPLTIDDFVLVARLFAEPDLGRCCWETIETRRGACDGGERCRNHAVAQWDGIAYCARHWPMPEGRA